MRADTAHTLRRLRRARGDWVSLPDAVADPCVIALRKRGYIIERRVLDGAGSRSWYRLLDGPKPKDWPQDPPHYDERDLAGA